MIAWSGTVSSGPGWVAFRGASAQNAFHAHPALQLTLGFAGDVTILGPEEAEHRGKAVLIHPGVRHRLMPHRDVAVVLIQPACVLAASILARAPTQPIATLDMFWHTAFNDRFATLSLSPHLRAALPALDKALDALRSAGSDFSIETAARAAGLSPSRLRVIAQKHLGLSLSQWLTWRKLERACAALARGASPAEAAIDGAFADQAHLTRTMRRILGITPGMSRAWRQDMPAHG
ncbi:MAG: helix-turn-helix transcriptional regulator [Burkholderiales bacterium]